MYTVSTRPRQGYLQREGDLSRPHPIWRYTSNTGKPYPISTASLQVLQEVLDDRLSREAQLMYAKYIKSSIKHQEAKFASVTGNKIVLRLLTLSRHNSSSLERCCEVRSV